MIVPQSRANAQEPGAIRGARRKRAPEEAASRDVFLRLLPSNRYNEPVVRANMFDGHNSIGMSKKIALVLLLSSFFCIYTTSVQDGDFFWHIKTGQWIWEHKALPSGDPFSVSPDSGNPLRPDSHRMQAILKQYWLGQLLLYGLWSMAGPAGIVLLRAGVYTLILLFLLLWMNRFSNGILPLVSVILLGDLLRNFPNERPQLFTFLFFPAVLYLIEKIRVDRTAGRGISLILCALMIAWANIHGGYILGVAVIGMYLGSYILLTVKDKGPLNRGVITAYSLSAVLPFLLNPLGSALLKALYETKAGYLNSIYENLSPFYVAYRTHDYFPSYWIFIAGLLVILISSFREICLEHKVTLSALMLLSFTGLRYMPYVLMAAPLAVMHVKERGNFSFRGGVHLSLVLGCLVASVFLGDWKNSFEFRTDRSFPSGAVRFIQANRLRGNYFNEYSWGGYLLWYLPGGRVFIDGRGLVEETSDLYDEAVWTDRGRDILDAYRVDVIIMPGMAQNSGEIFPLTRKLHDDDRWALVYADDIALVFVRNLSPVSDVVKKYAMDKKNIYAQILSSAELFLKREPDNAGFWFSKAEALYETGRAQEAVGAYRKAVAIDPANARAGELSARLSQGGVL